MTTSYESALRESYREVRKRLRHPAEIKPKTKASIVETQESIAASARRVRPPVRLSRRMLTRYVIIEVVEETTKLHRADIKSRYRDKRLIEAKRLILWLGRHFDIADGLKSLARVAGLMDHSSAWHHITRATERAKDDEDYAALLDALAHQVQTIIGYLTEEEQ